MKMNGVPQGGNRVSLTEGLSAQLLFGAAYGRDKDGTWTIVQLKQPLPKKYKDRTFELDDEAEFLWKISSFHEMGAFGYSEKEFLGHSAEELGGEITPETVKVSAENALDGMFASMVQGAPDPEPYELGSSTKVEETEDGFTLHANISSKAAGGSYTRLSLSENITAVILKKDVQILGLTLSFPFLYVLAIAENQVRFYSASLSVPDAGEGFQDYEKALTPFLTSLELDPGTPVPEQEPEETEVSAEAEKHTQGNKECVQTSTRKQRKAAKEKKPLRETDGRLNAFVVLKLIEDGAIPVKFEELEWRDEGCIQARGNYYLDKAGDYAHEIDENFSAVMDSFHELISFLEEDTELRLPAAALAPDLQALLPGKELTGLVWLAMVSSHLFHVEEEKKNSYSITRSPDFDRLVSNGIQMLEAFIRALRAFNHQSGGFYLRCSSPKNTNDKEVCQRPVPQVLKLPKQENLPMTAIAQLLSTKQVDYYESRISWDGTNYRVEGVTLAVDNDLPQQQIVQTLMNAFETLEKDESLRIPSEKVSPALRTFLSQQVSSGFQLKMGVDGACPVAVQDLTGSMLLHMILWKKLVLQEIASGTWNAYVAQDLAQSVPDDKQLLHGLISALRSIDGVNGTFSVETKIFSDWDGPFPFPLLQTEKFESVIQCRDMDASKVTAMRGFYASQEEKLDTVPFDKVSSVTLSGKTFVLTGEFAREENDRDRLSKCITARGGRVTGAVSGKTSYLVVGSLGNFGQRKVEQAKEQQAKGSSIKIIKEEDLFRALDSKQASSSEPKSVPKATGSVKNPR